MDFTTQVDRSDVIAAFTDTNPPASPTRQAPPPIIIGLWGGLLEGGRIAIDRAPTGPVSGELVFP